MPHDLRHITEIVVHHSASDPRTTTWKTIRRWHIARFKLGIGYHRIIEYDGTCFDGRRVQVRGAHAPPNSGRIGICVTGDNTQPGFRWSGPQWRSLVVELKYQIARHPEAIVLGHNDTKATLCPGVDIGKELRARGFPAAHLIGG